MKTSSRQLRRVLLVVLLGILTAGLGVYLWLFADLPPIDRLNAGLALPSTRIYDRYGTLLYEVLPPQGGRNTAVPLSDIPAHCIDAVLSTEDTNYYSHPGVDAAGVARALWINLRGGEVLAGGSTITQQVARNLLLDPSQRADRSLTRKLREMILALRLSAALSKDEVLALYLNQSYFGSLAYGIDAAARAYFDKQASDLSLAECALLAGLLQAPARYDPLTQLDAARERQAVVLGLMVQTGRLSSQEAELASQQPLHFAASPFPIQAPHFVMAVIAQLERDYGDAFYGGGLEVITTLDLSWQQTAERLTRRQLEYLNQPGGGRVPANARNAALVALDPHTGQILTMLGSPDYFDASIDGAVNATLALRQPGSALKPFTYAAAFDPAQPDPWTGATMLLDIETPFVTRSLESYTPANFALAEHGPVLARDALASSLNIPAVVALNHIGVPTLIELLHQAGVQTLADNPDLDLALTLGGGEVRLLDLTAAYGIFANAGWRVEPVYLLRVSRASGEVLYEWQPSPPAQRVIDPRVAALITDILSDDEARILGFGQNSMLNIGRPAAAKTGTTTNFRDNWIVGYTPNLLVGVWVGNADNAPMVDVTGVSGAAPIWNAFMRQTLLGQPELPFELPPGMAWVDICALSGLLPTPECPQRRRELFIDGTQPTQPDTFYQRVTIDAATGLLADASTPPERRVERTYIMLPPEARDWGLRSGLLPPPTGAAVAAVTGEALRLLEPDPYAIFRLSARLPRADQRIRLAVAVPEGTQAVTYLLDGVPLDTVTAEPWALWWTLEAGEHELVAQAHLADGSVEATEPLPFTVNPPQP